MAPNLKYPKDFSNLAALQASINDHTDARRPGNPNDAIQASADATFPPLTASLKQDETRTGKNVAVPTVVESNTHTKDRHHDSDDEYFHTDIEEPPATSDDHRHQEGSSSSNKDMTVSSVLEASEQQQEQDQGKKDKESRARQSRKVLRKLSSIVNDPQELNIDQRRLQRATEEVGKFAYGIQAISVWLFDDENDKLCPSEGGWWHNPTLPPSEALSQLVDFKRIDHVPATDVSPGVDVAGVLWLESNKFERVASMMMLNRVTSSNYLNSAANSTDTLSSLHRHHAHHKDEVLIWRDLKSLAEDPDTAKGPRMALLQEAGMGQVTGIEFQTELFQRGMVVFFAKKDLDGDVLNGHANFHYLRQAAQYIGGAAAMAEARRALVGQQIEKGMIRKRSDVSSDIESGRQPTKKNVDDKKMEPLPNHKDEDEPNNRKCGFVLHRMKVWIKKTKGGGLQVPPSLSVRQCLWTAFGAFCGLLVLSSLNEYYQYLSDGDYALLIGPFGALMTLQYGLTAAPASQPRNAIMGQAVSGAVSLALTYIPEEILPVWLRRAVGPAIAIATMVKCGFTHPPAGAHAVLYASGKYNFAFYSLVVLSTVISVIPATLVNNMSIKRQYPTYWGFPNLPESWTLPRGWVPDISSAFKTSKRTCSTNLPGGDDSEASEVQSSK